MSGTTYKIDKAPFSQIPAGADLGMAANDAPGLHDLLAFNAAGYGVTLTGAESGLYMAGVCDDQRSTSSTTAGANVVRIWNGFGREMPMSSAVGDAFTATDHIAPVYVSASKELGKLGTDTGVPRVIAGLFLRFNRDGEPQFWLGAEAQTVARAMLAAEGTKFARYDIADGSASATLAERVIGRVTVPGVVTAGYYTGAAFAADNTDYMTLTLAKRSVLDSYAAATTIATLDSRAANQGAATAFTPLAWALSGTAANLRLIPGDVITLVEAKGGAGKSAIGEISLVGKVI